MFNYFKLQFKTIESGIPNLVLREPSGILVNLIYDKQKLFAIDDEGSVPQAVHKALFVLACLYEYESENSVCLKFYESWLQDNTSSVNENEHTFSSVEHLYKHLNSEAFVKFIFTCITLIPTSKLTEWYKLIDAEFYFTEKAKTELKND